MTNVSYGFKRLEVTVPMAPRVGELAGKRRKRARLWRRAHPWPYVIDTSYEASILGKVIRAELDALGEAADRATLAATGFADALTEHMESP
jgi:hypothetical protein